MSADLRNLADIVAFHARQRPQGRAFICGERTTAYADLAGRMGRIAGALLAAGLKPQSRIAFLDRNTDLYFELLLGANAAGLVMTPVNWRLAPEELIHVIGDSSAEMLFVGAEFLPAVAQVRDRLPALRRIVVLEGPAEGIEGYEAWLGTGGAGALPEPSATAIALQLYTSGTTGRAKGALLTNGNLLAALRKLDTGAFGTWSPRDLNIVVLPTFHIGGTIWGLYTLYAGGTGLVLRDAHPDGLIQAFRTHPITKAGFVPAMMQMLLDHPGCATADFSHLDIVGYGAAPISEALMMRSQTVFGCGLLQIYGMTESTAGAVVLRPEDHDPSCAGRLRSCGRPLPGVELAIVTPDGRPAAAGEVGEILLRGETVMQGYWGLPDETVRAIADGWLRTGDAGYRDAEGYVYICDRVKDMVISGGENIYPAEVENALWSHPAIADVAVIGVPDARWGEAVMAIVVPRPGSAPSEAEIIAHARLRLAHYKCPKSVSFVDALPRNATGKVLKHELRQRYWADLSRRVN